jgi:pentatricopeptide repeat protein
MVWKLWREVFDKGFGPSDQLYGTMIDVLVFNGRMDEALKLFDEMKKRFSSSDGRFSTQNFSSAYASLIRGFSQRKECQRAMHCFQEMQANDVKVSLVVFNTLIDACSRVSDMDRGAKLFSDMVAAGCTPDLITYSTLIKGYCLCGDMDQGMQLFTVMRKKGIQPDAVVFNSVLDGCAKKQMRVLCEQVIRDMAEAGVSPSNHSVSILVKLYGRCRDLEAAFRVVDEMPRDHGFKANAAVYTCLMSACIANNGLNQAMDLRKRMIKECVSLDQKTYSTLLRGAIRSSNIETASELIHAALNQGAGLLEEELVQNALFLISRRGLSEQVGQPLLRRLREHGMHVRCPEEKHDANFGGFARPPARTLCSENRLHNRRAMGSENRFRNSGMNSHGRY